MERDFFTLCANAQTYNEEASLIYEDSVRLRNVFIEVRRRYESGPNSDESEDNEKGTYTYLFIIIIIGMMTITKYLIGLGVSEI